jgi:seryl-tRNA synthetase
MLDVKFVRENIPAVEEALRRRRSTAPLEGFVEIDRSRRALLSSVETLRAERNAASEEIGRLRREKKDASALMEKMKQVAARIKEKESDLPELERRMEQSAFHPQPPDASVPGCGRG